MTGERGSDHAQPSDQLREEAAFWFARMRGEEAQAHRAAFEQWLALGAVHRAAYNRIGEIFAAGKVLKRDHRTRPAMSRWAAGVSVIAVVTAFVVSAWAWRSERYGPSDIGVTTVSAANAQHATQVGRMATLRLADGTKAILDTDTLVVGDVDGDPRVVRLDRGRVRFATPPHHAGPIILVGGYRAGSANGTFDLALGGAGEIDAMVLRGMLSIRPLAYAGAGQPGEPVRVGAGQRLHIDPDGTMTLLTDRVGRDWPSRVLEVRSARLTDVLTRANRYSARKIVLADAALADRRISGRFRVDDPDRLASHLAAVLSLSVDRSTPGVIVLGASVKESSWRH